MLNESAIPMISGLIFNFLMFLFVYFALYKIKVIKKQFLLLFSAMLFFVSALLVYGIYDNSKTSDSATLDAKILSDINTKLNTYKAYHDNNIPESYEILTNITPKYRNKKMNGIETFVNSYDFKKININSKDNKISFEYTIKDNGWFSYYYCVNLSKDIFSNIKNASITLNDKNLTKESDIKNYCNYDSENKYSIILK